MKFWKKAERAIETPFLWLKNLAPKRKDSIIFYSKLRDLSVKMFKCKGDLSNIKAGCVLKEYSLPLKVHEQFSPAQVFQNQIKLSLCLRRLSSTRSS